eukprot:scaffold437253_cov50-Prasinocladus_malaysianus.AAC.1
MQRVGADVIPHLGNDEQSLEPLGLWGAVGGGDRPLKAVQQHGQAGAESHDHLRVVRVEDGAINLWASQPGRGDPVTFSSKVLSSHTMKKYR